jgi:putative transposase
MTALSCLLFCKEVLFLTLNTFTMTLKKQKKGTEIDPETGLSADFLKQFKDKSAFDDFFQKLFKRGIETLLEGELAAHLGYEKSATDGYNTGNSRNGFSTKRVKTDNLGDVVLNIPRDRQSTFEPLVIPKHTRMSDKLEDAITGMYARGMTTSDIADQVREIYGVEVSTGTISNITNKLIEEIKAWQSRPLLSQYYVVWMDGIRLKVRHNGKIADKTVFLVIGLTPEGQKEVLGMWINSTESAAFWLTVLTDLRTRGVEDILIACTDNLTGFTDAIHAAFPNTMTQLCIVHQIRNSTKFVVSKERKAFCADLKAIYDAPNQQVAADALDKMEAKWGEKYGYAIKSWRNNWTNLIAFLDYPPEIRKIIYTTNTIESLNAGIRKYTNSRNIFPDDNAALKAVYLALNNIEKKWTAKIPKWGLIVQQFKICFGERCKID